MHVMVDVEGIGLCPNGAMLSIGAIRFDPYLNKYAIPYFAEDNFQGESFAYCDAFHVNIKIASAAAVGLEIDPDTVAWWMGATKDSPNEEARKACFHPQPVPIKEAAKAFRDYLDIGDKRRELIWSNPMDYDIVMLAAMYRVLGQHIPWRHQQLRDLPSFSTGIPYTETRVPIYGVEHHPVWDACRQATWLAKAVAWKRKRMPDWAFDPTDIDKSEAKNTGQTEAPAVVSNQHDPIV